MFEAFETMGLETAWLPLLVALVGLPVLYINLAMDAFKDYGELVKGITGESDRAPVAATTTAVQSISESDSALETIRDELRIFDLDWWVVAALGVLLFAMVCAANLPASATITKACSSSDQGDVVKGLMSLYATGFGLLVGFRLVWARLAIARSIRMYHELRLKPGLIAKS
jgi:hypothetical protein